MDRASVEKADFQLNFPPNHEALDDSVQNPLPKWGILPLAMGCFQK